MFELTLRRDSHGGGLLREPRGTAAAFRPRRYAVLLVHGYKVDEDEADRSYRIFKKALVKLAPRIDVDVGFVYWPGDGSVPALRALKYPEKVPVAVLGSSQLAHYISSRRRFDGGPAHVVIVAHSLGCRLTLEAIARLPDTSNDVSLFLMAAAVPVSTVEPNGHLNASLSRAGRRWVFYSSSDLVLKGTFGIGQRLAGDRGLPQAVGLRGRPERHAWTARKRMTGYGHSDYWTSEDVPRFVASALFGAVPMPAKRPEPEPRLLAVARALTEPRKFLKRRLGG